MLSLAHVGGSYAQLIFSTQIPIKPNYKGTPADLLDRQREDHPVGQTAT